MKKHKFTWIDALVIAVVILLLIGTYMKFFTRETTSVQHETKQLQIQLEISGVRHFSADALQTGDVVYVSTGKGQIGTITDVQVNPYMQTYEKPDGKLVQAQVEGRCSIVLTLRAEGISTANTYKVGTNLIYLDQPQEYFTKYLSFTAQTISINED